MPGSDIQADLAKVLVGFLIAERLDDIVYREVLVDHRADAVGVDGADHLLLLRATADQHTLQTQLAHQCRDPPIRAATIDCSSVAGPPT